MNAKNDQTDTIPDSSPVLEVPVEVPVETPDYIHLNTPIDDLDVYHQSLLFAHLSRIAYLDEENASRQSQAIGLKEHIFFDRDGAQAYLFQNDYDTIFVCRGTEANQWNDIRADLRVIPVVAETIGRVHRGFKEEVDDIWPRAQPHLKDPSKSLWFTGHSLGAAMATICASRCKLANDYPDPIGLFTFGSPRVGNKKYVSHAQIKHIRWVNNNDVVTRVPPTSFSYRHTGQEFYLNAYGQLRTLSSYQRLKDRARGIVDGLKNGRIDFFSDHLINFYIEHITNIIKEEKLKSQSAP